MTVAAVVVTFNRRELLVECLDALHAQTRPADVIIVIDNASTDGTDVLLREKYHHLRCYRSERNLGGAGGFAWGVELALRAGYDDAWLMDDDAAPTPEALMGLLEASAQLSATGPKPGFVACQVVDNSGQNSSRHRLTPLATTGTRSHSVEAVAVDCAHFVGALINLDIARRTHLPVPDFFLWHDDIEYTTRLGEMATGYLVPGSLIHHPDKPELNDYGWRLFHDVKNRVWMMKTPQLANRHARIAAFKRIPKILLQQAIRAESKTGFLRHALRGLFIGLVKKPALFLPGELLASSNDVRLVANGSERHGVAYAAVPIVDDSDRDCDDD